MLRKKGVTKIHQIRDRPIVGIGPPGSKFKAIACALSLPDCAVALLLDVGKACGIAVILCVGAIGDDKELYIFKEPASRPERFAIVPVDLVEGFLDIYASFFKLNVHKW